MAEEKKAAAEKREQSVGFTRRTFALGAVGAVSLVALGAGAKIVPSKTLLRPPGGQDEVKLWGSCQIGRAHV